MALTSIDNTCIILCDNCFLDITSITRVNCLCGYDICPSCFYAGVLLPGHSSTDQYFAIEPLTTIPGEGGWSAFEELLFIDCLSALGIGNWEGIAARMLSRTAAEVEDYFHRLFRLDNNRALEGERVAAASNPYSPIMDCYAPLRREIEVEANNLFETEFWDADADADFADLVMDMYRDLLKYRKMRRYFIFEKKLVDFCIREVALKNKGRINMQKNHIQDVVLNKPIREAVGGKIIGLAPLITKSDFNKLYKGLCIEEHLKKQLYETKPETDPLKLDIIRKEMLSDDEIHLCNALDITYSSYLKIKAYAITQNIKHSHVSLGMMKKITNSDNRIKILFDYFRYNGWIRSKN